MFYYLVLFFLPLALYKVFCGRDRSTDWYYFVRRLLCKRQIKQFLSSGPRKQMTVGVAVKATESVALYDQPKFPHRENNEDLWVLNARDAKGNSIFLKIIYGNENLSLVLLVRTARGQHYILPENSQVFPHGTTGDDDNAIKRSRGEWKCKILSVQALMSGNFSNYRIVFNGCVMATDTKQISHMNFNLFFKAAASKMAYPTDFHKGLFEDAVCNERWRNGHWISMLGDQNGYHQLGAIHGTIQGHDQQEPAVEEEWYLRGHLQRSYGTCEDSQFTRSDDLLLHCENGTLLQLNLSSLSIGCRKKLVGCLYSPDGKVTSVTQSDFCFIGPNAKQFVIHVKTAHSWIKCAVYLDESTECSATNLTSQLGKCTFNDLQATAVLNVQTFTRRKSKKDRFLIRIDSKEAMDAPLTGGKGSSLSVLAQVQKQFQFVVPAGFVLTTKVFDSLFSNNKELAPYLRDLSSACYSKVVTLKEIESVCKMLETQIATNGLLKRQLLKIFKAKKEEIIDVNKLWAVRSSGTCEDGESASAAGQNETVLGCKDLPQIVDAILICWASLFSFRSVEYRRNRGLPVIETNMAVVIQEMVHSDAAGVMFTCDDFDGNPLIMKITSNYGLGESIVSGLEHGDVITIRRDGDSLTVSNVQVNQKTNSIQLKSDGGGIQKVALAATKAHAQSITNEQAVALATVGCLLEDHYGLFLDIEWAFTANRNVPCLLQARPVTFLDNWTTYEIEHELDDPIMSDWNVYLTSNVKEVMPGAITPLTNSIAVTLLNAPIMENINRVPISSDPLHAHPSRQCVLTLSNHVFMAHCQTLLRFPPNERDVALWAMELCIAGHAITDEQMLERSKLMWGGPKSSAQTLLMTLRIVGDVWTMSKDIRRAKELAHIDYSKWLLKANGNFGEILKLLDDGIDRYYQLSQLHSQSSRVCSFFEIVALSMLAKGQIEGIDHELYALVASCLGSGDGVISAEIPKELEAIAESIRTVPEKQAQFVAYSEVNLLDWLQEQIPEAHHLLVQFLKKHGHRYYREFELKESSWAREPQVVLKMLQALCRASPGNANTNSNNGRRTETETIEQVLNQLPPDVNRIVFKYLIRKCRESVCNRETTKSELIRAGDNLKTIFATLARELHNQQLIPQESLIYFFTFDELRALIHKKRNASTLITRALLRLRLHSKWENYRFPEVNTGFPVPVNPIISKPEIENGTGSVSLKGVAVCGGSVTARCCCFDSIDDVDLLQEGDVLITNGTDVAWTPYFPLISGIVTELGGLISHGAVIAREYGLPCLIGVEGALQHFQTGDTVTLDGSQGVIYKNPL